MCYFIFAILIFYASAIIITSDSLVLLYCFCITDIIRKIIGVDKINKPTFANNTNDFIIAVQTNIEKSTCTNQIFSDLIKIKGIKKIDKQMYC